MHVASEQLLQAGENPWGSSAWRVAPSRESKTDVSSTKHTRTVTEGGAKLCPPGVETVRPGFWLPVATSVGAVGGAEGLNVTQQGLGEGPG